MAVCQYFLKGDCRFGDKCRYEHPTAKKKTVCPHFMNGYCRFGDKCWNEHPTGRGGGGFGQQQSGFGGRGGQWGRSSHSNQNRFEVLSSGTGGSFGVQHSRAVESDQTISQIQKTIQNDMAIWEKSKQWPLSCYTYTKEEPCLQDLLDFSPEEIRLEAYNANAEGKADSYQQGLKTLITANQQKRRQLSRMSVSQIQEEIKKQSELKAVESMDAGSLVQQSSSGTAIFSENSTFGQSGGSGFGSNTPLFQSTGFSAVASTSNQSSSLFGSGGATNQSNLFGQSSVTGLSGSVFGNTVGSSNQQTGMTGSTATGQSGLFGTNFSQSAAGNTGLFGVKPELKTGLFGSASSTASSGVFGSEPQLQNNGGTISANHTSNSSLKSTPEAPLSREQSPSLPLTCSEEDIQAFKADSFVLGKIPECPPPLELC